MRPDRLRNGPAGRCDPEVRLVPGPGGRRAARARGDPGRPFSLARAVALRAICGPSLDGNWGLQRRGHFAFRCRFDLPHLETQLLRAAMQRLLQAFPHLLRARRFRRLHVRFALPHQAVEDPRQLVCGRRDRFRRAQPRTLPPQVSTQRALAPHQAARCQTQRLRRADGRIDAIQRVQQMRGDLFEVCPGGLSSL